MATATSASATRPKIPPADIGWRAASDKWISPCEDPDANTRAPPASPQHLETRSSTPCASLPAKEGDNAEAKGLLEITALGFERSLDLSELPDSNATDAEVVAALAAHAALASAHHAKYTDPEALAAAVLAGALSGAETTKAPTHSSVNTAITNADSAAISAHNADSGAHRRQPRTHL